MKTQIWRAFWPWLVLSLGGAEKYFAAADDP